MNPFSDIIGNKKSIDFFASLIESKKLSHAYLLSGPRGSGKKKMALSIAAFLAKQSTDEAICEMIIKQQAPDVAIIKRPEDKKTIGVDVIRDFISKVALSPSDLDFKFYIFDEADLMTPQAQNSLLKIIEEPPKDVYIFLLCENPSSMLQTVRSRVQSFQMERFSSDFICDYLKKNTEQGRNSNSDVLDFASRMSSGSIGKAIELLTDSDGYDIYRQTVDIIDIQSKKRIGSVYFDFLQKISVVFSNREAAFIVLDYLSMAYRDILMSKIDEDADTVFYSREKAYELSELFAKKAIELSMAAVSKIRSDLVYNTNIGVSLSFLAISLWNAV